MVYVDWALIAAIDGFVTQCLNCIMVSQTSQEIIYSDNTENECIDREWNLVFLSSGQWCQCLLWISINHKFQFHLGNIIIHSIFMFRVLREWNYLNESRKCFTYTAKLLFRQSPARHSHYIMTGQCVVTVDNCRQSGDWTANGSVVTSHSHYTITVQSQCSDCA